MKKQTYELNVLIKNRKINEYLDPTTAGKYFVEGRQGSEFELELINNGTETVLMVPSIDGLSILDGKPASEHSKGYIIEAGKTMKIPGWTLDNDSAAKFIFADKKKSYSANHPVTPSEDNIGVIGVLVFSKKLTTSEKLLKEALEMFKRMPQNGYYTPGLYREYNYYPPLNQPLWIGTHQTYCGTGIGSTPGQITCGNIVRSNAGEPTLQGATIMNASMDASGVLSNAATGSIIETTNCVNAVNQLQHETTEKKISINTEQELSYELGTGFGDQTEFKTISEFFNRDTIVATLVLYYDSRKNLEKLGIKFAPVNPVEPKKVPNPFPNMGCVPPTGWKQS